ncbi:MAG: isopentenyl phosphate kinase [Candidatus Micrarchaeota archaeon]|nr:MAG: isopentenyl phosphate kinase [Candidatus Micrarchaeota archaeon]
MDWQDYLYIIKIGGSSISNKETGNYFIEETIKIFAKDLISFLKEHPNKDLNLFIIHGAGFRGHHIVKSYSLNALLQDNYKNIRGWHKLNLTQIELSDKISRELARYGIYSINIPGRAIGYKDNNNSVIVNRDLLKSIVDRSRIKFVDNKIYGVVAISCGDIIYHNDKGLSIISGDTIAKELSYIKPSIIIHGTDVDGVIDKSGSIIKRIEKEEDISSIKRFDSSNRQDVTGGIIGKVLESLRSNANRSYIINLRKEGMLRSALALNEVGTIIERRDNI